MDENILASFTDGNKKVSITKHEIIFSSTTHEEKRFPLGEFVFVGKSISTFINPSSRYQDITAIRFENVKTGFVEEFSGLGIDEFHAKLISIVSDSQ